MIPNIFTGLRVLLVLPILACINKGGPQEMKAAAMIFLVAILTDMLDGQLARRLNQTSTFGAMFDLTADRLIMTPTLLMMSARGAFHGTNWFPLSPGLYLFIIITADIVTIIGIFMYTKLRKKDPTIEFPTPTPIVKATYPAQALVVFFALLSLKPQLIAVFMFIAAGLTVTAFFSYMKKGGYVFKQGLPVVIEEAKKEFSEEEQPAAPATEPETKQDSQPKEQ